MTSTASSRRGADDANKLDLNQVVAPLRQHWLRFLLRWMLISGLCLLAGVNLGPGFEATGGVYLDNPSNHGSSSAGTGSSDTFGGSMLSLLGSGSDLESQKGILLTNDLALEIISQLGLNASLKGPDQYLPEHPNIWQYYFNRDPNRFKRGLYIKDSDDVDQYYGINKYRLIFTQSNHFQVLDTRNHDQVVGAGQVGLPTTTSHARFTLDAYTPTNVVPGTAFKLLVQPAQLSLKGFEKALVVEGGGKATKQNNLITATFGSGSPYMAQRVVETLLNKFVDLNRQWDSSVSHAIVEFTEADLKKISDDMDKASEQLAVYEKASGLIAVDKQEEAQVKSLVEAQVDLDKNKLNVLTLEQLEKGLASGKPDMFLLSFISDPLLQGLGKNLAEINGQLDAMETQFHGDYPGLEGLRAQRQALLKDIQASVVSSIARAKQGIIDASQVVQGYNQRFAAVPEKARVLANYDRANEVYLALYTFLIQQKQKAEIAEGSTLSNIRIYEHPLVPIKESWPGNTLLVAVCAVLGLMASAASVIVPALRVRWYTTVEEVKAAFTQPIFAVVPHRGSSPGRASPAIVETKLQSQFVESIRLLRANLQHTMAGRKHQTVLITSAMPQDGKSSITANLAITLARSERVNGVLLVDVDMHHPSMHGIFGLRQSPGLSDLLNGSASLGDVIQTVDVDGGRHVDVICAGEVPPSPVELVDSQAMQNLLAYAKEHYTFALLDSPPYPLIATSSVLAPLADRVLSICRLGHTDRSLFRTHVEDLSSFCKHVGLIVNLRELGRRHGAAYGKGYKKYGGYGARDGAKLIITPGTPGGSAKGQGPAKPAEPRAERPTTPRN